ncbi:hypothetical protein Pfo_024016 [Paulownia fortunei]|nr:hypothetical protein Pfo_024016 [Paulownia fortunei]
MINPITAVNNIQFSSSTTTMANKTNSPLQFSFCNDIEQSSIASFSPTHFPPSKPIYHMENRPCPVSISNGDNLNPSYTFSSTETSEPASKCAINDASSLLLDMSTSILGDFGKGSENVDFSVFQEQCNGFSATVPEDMQGNLGHGEEAVLVKGQNVGQVDDLWGTIRSIGHPYSFPLSLPDEWKSNSLWDSSSCPSELSTSYSTNNCYT